MRHPLLKNIVISSLIGISIVLGQVYACSDGACDPVCGLDNYNPSCIVGTKNNINTNLDGTKNWSCTWVSGGGNTLNTTI
jgi:hypothetical protein